MRTRTLFPGDEPRGNRARVLHLVPDLQIGGGQTIILNHVRHADTSRYQIGVCQLETADEMAPAFREAGVEPVYLHWGRSRRVRFVSQLVRLMKRDGVDIVHVHSTFDRTYGQLGAAFAGVPVVGHLHSEWMHLGPLPTTNWPARQRARLLGAIRDRIERRVVKHYVAESVAVRELFQPRVDQPITVLRQAIPLERFVEPTDLQAGRRELGLADGPVLVNVSRLVDGKGQHHLIDAMPAILERHPRAQLVLVGDGDLRPTLVDRAVERGVADNVIFLGNRLDVPVLLLLADVFVFASATEGFGLVVLEAMAARLPVVAFRLPALQEFAVEGETARLVEQDDVDGLARNTIELLDDETLRATMGSAGRRVVEDRFPSDAVARTFEEVYDAVLQPSDGP